MTHHTKPALVKLVYGAKKITLKQTNRLRIDLVGAQGTFFTESRCQLSYSKMARKKVKRKIKRLINKGRKASKKSKISKVKKLIKLALSRKKRKRK